MHRHILVALLLLVSLCLAAVAADTKAVTEENLGGTPDQVTLTTEEQQYLDLTNQARKAEGLGEVTIAPLLVKVAREKSREMYELNYWGHKSPVKEKQTAMSRVLYYLPKRPVDMTVGENLCYTSRVMITEGHQALMDSPTHRKNIMNPIYEYVGMGSYTAPDGRFWLTQIFVDVTY